MDEFVEPPREFRIRERRDLFFRDQLVHAVQLIGEFHFGALDRSTPAEDIDAHRLHQPAAQVFAYAGAGHAFNRDIDPTHYHAASATLAKPRTLAFLREHTT